MDIQQIIDYIKTSVKSTRQAFEAKGLEYNPEIIASAVFKELKQQDASVDHETFDRAIDQMEHQGLIESRANGLVFFNEMVLN